MYHEVDIIQNTYNFLINQQISKSIVLLTVKKKREKGEKERVQYEIE